MNNATLYSPDRTSKVISPANGIAFTLAELQALVDGYIQYIDLPEGQVMIINEEGKLKRQPLNPVATRIANLAFGDWIAGPAVVGHANVFGQEEREPFTLDQFEELIEGADFVIFVPDDEDDRGDW